MTKNRVPFVTKQKETTVHLFWERKFVQKFLIDYINWLLKSCKHICIFRLSLELVIFGSKDNIKTDVFFFICYYY